MSSDILKTLRNLKDIGPNPEWKKAKRDFLLTRIKSDLARNEINLAVESSWERRLSFAFGFLRLTARPALSVASIVVLVLGGGLSVSAAQNSLPGDTFYSLKIASEKVQVALTFNDGEKVKKHVELAGKRLDEAKKIKMTVDSQKIQNMNIAINKFKEEIKNVRTNLDGLATDSVAKMEVAKMVDAKASEYQTTLTEAKLDASPEVAEKISEGMNLTDEAGDSALTVIVGKGAEDNSANSEDVLRRVSEKLGEMEAKAKEVAVALEGANVEEKEIAAAKNDLAEADKILADAKKAIEKNDAQTAFNKLMESKGLIRQADGLVAEAKKTVAIAAPEENTATPQKVIEPKVEEPTQVSEQPNTIAQKVYSKPVVKPVVAMPAAPVEIDESKLKVGIDLRQEAAE